MFPEPLAWLINFGRFFRDGDIYCFRTVVCSSAYIRPTRFHSHFIPKYQSLRPSPDRRDHLPPSGLPNHGCRVGHRPPQAPPLHVTPMAVTVLFAAAAAWLCVGGGGRPNHHHIHNVTHTRSSPPLLALDAPSPSSAPSQSYNAFFCLNVPTCVAAVSEVDGVLPKLNMYDASITCSTTTSFSKDAVGLWQEHFTPGFFLRSVAPTGEAEWVCGARHPPLPERMGAGEKFKMS